MCKSSIVQMTIDLCVLGVLKNAGAIVNSSEEAPIKVTLIKRDRLSHVKGCRNSCSLANFAVVE